MDEAFTQINFGPLKQFLDNDDVTDISYSGGGNVWLKTLSQGVYRVDNTGIDNPLMEKIAFQCANSMGKAFNMANPFSLSPIITSINPCAMVSEAVAASGTSAALKAGILSSTSFFSAR